MPSIRCDKSDARRVALATHHDFVVDSVVINGVSFLELPDHHGKNGWHYYLHNLTVTTELQRLKKLESGRSLRFYVSYFI